MKLIFKRWISSSIRIATFIAGFTLLVSCANDQLAPEDRSQNQQELSDQSVNPSPFSAAMSCPDNLTDDGCNFVTGSGRDHPNQFTMVGMMNNCRTESLPAGCSWAGNVTQTKIIEVDLNNCCYPFSSLNFAMNSWKALAASNRPAGNYLIINYQRINGYMVTVYGPYRMVIQVTYRKKGNCAVVGEEKGDIIAYPE